MTLEGCTLSPDTSENVPHDSVSCRPTWNSGSCFGENGDKHCWSWHLPNLECLWSLYPSLLLNPSLPFSFSLASTISSCHFLCSSFCLFSLSTGFFWYQNPANLWSLSEGRLWCYLCYFFFSHAVKMNLGISISVGWSVYHFGQDRNI